VTVDQAGVEEAAALQIPELQVQVHNHPNHWPQVVEHAVGDIRADLIQTLLLTREPEVVVLVAEEKTAVPEELLEEVKAE
jgi:hypothetical protein